MTTEIKMLGPMDGDVLTRIAPGVFDKPVNNDLTNEFLEDPRHHIAVAIDDGLVVGFVSALHYLHPDKPPELWINEVGVAESHQRQGLGKKLLAEILNAAGRVGCAEAWVLTNRSNKAAMQLYASSGGGEAPNDQMMFTFRISNDA